jgi:predicted DNA-binding transcriptional regulator YafY
MRADRLLAVLMLLQARGRVTAAEVAAELEVSERTARRDLDALGMAGVPVFSTQGRGGGWELVGGARTDLTGLTSDEARALFLVAGPASSATPEVRAALRKLLQALPEPFRPAAEAASSAVIIDPTGWGAPPELRERLRDRPPPAHLAAVQKAVVEGEQADLGYVARDGSATTRRVHPLGLAAKRGTWYLVADTDNGLRTFRIDRVTGVEPAGEPVVRPDGFDLDEAWRMVTAHVDRSWARVTVHAAVVADWLDLVRSVLRGRLRIGPARPDGRVEVEIDGDEVRAIAGELAGWGSAVEVLEPTEVRAALAEVGRELLATYAPPS